MVYFHAQCIITCQTITSQASITSLDQRSYYTNLLAPYPLLVRQKPGCHSATSLQILNMPSPPSNLGVEDQHNLSQELEASKNPSREDQTPDQAAQQTGHTESEYTEVQEPGESYLDSKEQPPAATELTVTFLPPANALHNSRIAARLLPHLPPYEWSFWTDHTLKRAKRTNFQGCAFCVVHRRLDNSNPGTPGFATRWWQSCFVAHSVHQKTSAGMFAIGEALAMAVDQCERISGIVFTKARIEMPGAAEEIKRNAATIPWPMPKVVNIFTANQEVLDLLRSCWPFGCMPARESRMRHTILMIRALSDLGVKVHLQWIPNLAGDIRDRWAHEGAHYALRRQCNRRRVNKMQVRRVYQRAQKDKPVTRLPKGHKTYCSDWPVICSAYPDSD